MTVPDDMRAFNRSVIDEFRANRALADPAWYRNLVVHPEVTIEQGTDAGVARFTGTASTAVGAERERLLGVLRSAIPTIAAHQDRTEREIPLVVIEYEP